MPADTEISLAELKSFSLVDIDAEDARYRRPLLRDAKRMAIQHPEARVVLLGSISTGKYVDVLQSVFAERLHFPIEFVGRGDMSRGGLMLRCVRARQELEYAPVAGAIRRGKRPPKPGLNPTSFVKSAAGNKSTDKKPVRANNPPCPSG